MGQICPGYRDPSSLIFRDESNHVINRARFKVSKRASTNHSVERTAPPQAQNHTSAPNQQRNPSAPDYHASRPSDVVGETMLGMSDVDLGVATFAGSSIMPELMSFHDPFNLDETGLFSLHQDASPSAMLVTGDGSGSATPVPASVSGRQSRVGASSAGGDDMALDKFPGDDSNRGDRQQLGHSNFTSSQPEDMARGLDFFLSHYVVRQSGPSSGFFDYVPAMLAQDDGGNDMLESAILALGFSGLARTTSQTDLLTRSMMMYTRTMERVNLALADPQAARRDSTIVSVLILAFYEFSKASIDGWKHHVEGATSLLNLRGRSQFSTPTGLLIFKDVFSQLLTNCLRSGSPMPSSLRMLRIEAANTISVSDPYWVACSGMVELLDLYQQISPGGYSFFPNSSGDSSSSSSLAAPSDSSNPTSTASGSSPASTSSMLSGSLKSANISIDRLERYLSQALEIDYRLESTFSKCPPEWEFTTKSNSSSNSYDPTGIQRNTNHIYHDVWIASTWNSMRVCRILANHAISHLLLRGASTDSNWFFDNNYTERLHQATQNIIRLRDEMLASVSQLMGDVTSPAQDLQKQQHERSKNNAGSAAGGYFACWVLLTVGSMHNLTHEIRAWTVAQLRRISCQTGIAQADDFANFVQSSNLRPPLSG
ncbi:hypothetical protein N7466_005909 [Penicillium verhagenii]|uniref:uncharacterized protein n=1 Tax=Penicillium verhagenii TaxID=1562060 RepID=UPI0025454A1D|nr:uncharacterized protein N7466_005909 [Penicillium verhagenii]KAJ5930416.1 hypothetical protein N7466_005909 [Penicillium verhagenii]